jgi:hypothetical protein
MRARRYFEYLRSLATIDGLRRVWRNDFSNVQWGSMRGESYD